MTGSRAPYPRTGPVAAEERTAVAPPPVGREHRRGMARRPCRGPSPPHGGEQSSWRSGRSAESDLREALPDQLAQVLPAGGVTGVSLQAPGPPRAQGTDGPGVTLGSLGPARPGRTLATVGTGQPVRTGLPVPAVPARRTFGSLGPLGALGTRRAAGAFGARRTLDPPRPLRAGRSFRPGRTGGTRASRPARRPGGTGGAGAPCASGRSLGAGRTLRTRRPLGAARLFRWLLRRDTRRARRRCGGGVGRVGRLCGGGRGMRCRRCDHGASRMVLHTLGP
ncbi:hypothetical protein GA0115235_122412 [Streptomyces sp. DpondAA-F4a]|nr:hypothetical protein GA0115235_122412 [Streptomyces sp. DpondAA-F4a]